MAALFHHRWGPALLSALDEGRGAKVVTLVQRLGASREAVRRTLAALAVQGVVRRNPGYGHPMRPEWILTAAGQRLAPACTAFLRGLRSRRLLEASRRKWAFPILLALGGGEERFSALGADLPGVTARALATTLRDMERAGVVHRRVVAGRPPRVLYRAAPAVRSVARALSRLAAASVPSFSRMEPS